MGGTMRHKLLVLFAIAVLSSTLFTVIGTGPAFAAAPAASGSIYCKILGSGVFSPRIPGSSKTVKVNFSAKSPAKSASCSGKVKAPNSAGNVGPVNVTGVAITGSGYIKKVGPGIANTCANFQRHDTIGVITVTYNWTSVPAIAPTVVKFTGGTASIVTPIPTRPFDKIRLPAPAGTLKVTTGSFAPAVAPKVVLVTTIKSWCGPGWTYTAFVVQSGSFIRLP